MDGRQRRSDQEPAGRTAPGDPGPSPDPGSSPDPGQPTVYQVRVRSHLDDRWTDWLEGLSVTREERGDTVLTVPIVDQAALHGLLRKLRDLGIVLVSINPTGPGQPGNASKEENR